MPRYRVGMWRALIAAALLAAMFWILGSQSLLRLPSAPPEHVSLPHSDRLSEEPTQIPREPILDIPPPGEPVQIELIETPKSRYAAAVMTESDSVYAQVIRGLDRPDVHYDPNLGHAARELAYQHSVFGGLVPRPVVDFLLRSGGSVDRTVMQAYTATAGDDLQVIQERVERIVGTRRDTLRRVGVGEAYIPGVARSRFIAILVSERRIEVSSAPRSALPNTRWLLSGTLPDGWNNPTALAMYPEGDLRSIQVRRDGRRFALEVPVGGEEGLLDVSLSATGPYGPSPLLQVPVYVGTALPVTMTVWMPPNEEYIQGTKEAEELAFDLLNADRKRYGLSGLVRLPRVDRIARGHSVDMRDFNYFGHWSENTGSPGDRLSEGQIKAAMYAENVAYGGSIFGAQEGLMHSLGHRKNILNPGLTHVGIGIAGKTEGESVRWYLTQLFIVPATDVDRDIEEKTLLTRIDSLRRSEGRRALARAAGLDRMAFSAAKIAAAGGTEDLAKRLMDDAREDGQTRGGGFAWIRVVADPDSIEFPAEVTSPQYERIGMAVVQLPDHPNGLVGVALLLTGAK